jgi:hypothetical protein
MELNWRTVTHDDLWYTLCALMCASGSIKVVVNCETPLSNTDESRRRAQGASLQSCGQYKVLRSTQMNYVFAVIAKVT